MKAFSLAGWNVFFAGLLIGSYVLWSHSVRSDRFEDILAESGGSEEETRSGLQWLNDVLGDSASIQEFALPEDGAFGDVAWEGLDLLEGDQELARACRAELARWTAQGKLPIEVTRLRAEASPNQEGWRMLILEGEGPQAITLATLQHLLAAEGADAGYLTDPARIQLDAQGDDLTLELRLRVWPLGNFVAVDGGKE